MTPPPSPTPNGSHLQVESADQAEQSVRDSIQSNAAQNRARHAPSQSGSRSATSSSRTDCTRPCLRDEAKPMDTHKRHEEQSRCRMLPRSWKCYYSNSLLHPPPLPPHSTINHSNPPQQEVKPSADSITRFKPAHATRTLKHLRHYVPPSPHSYLYASHRNIA